MEKESSIKDLGKSVSKQKEISQRMKVLSEKLNRVGSREREMILSEIQTLKNSLYKINKQGMDSVKKISMYRSLNQTPPSAKKEVGKSLPTINAHLISQLENKKKKKGFELSKIESETIKRMKKRDKEILKEHKEKQKVRKPKKYVKMSSKYFYKYSVALLKKGRFKKLPKALTRANLDFIPINYISFMLFTTSLALIASFFIMIFFLFFNLFASPPFITFSSESIFLRFSKVFWIMVLIPAVTFGFIYFFPSAERKSLENKLNAELPFATIHMSSISSSLVEPSKIFSIIVATKEYPNLSKEFIKLLNDINVYGYDLVTALRNTGFNSPSKKLSELFSGLATTITSGGHLPDFFEKRSQTLLFEYRLEREKQSKAAETFMDIYISVVIAAPMILMLLLMMMRVSGLGLALGTGTITIIMILGVTLINILFLTFLHLKTPAGEKG